MEISCGEGEGDSQSANRGDAVGCSIEIDQGELEWVEQTFTGDSIGRLTGEQGFTRGGTAVESARVEARIEIDLGPNLTKEVEAPAVDLLVAERGWVWPKVARRRSATP